MKSLALLALALSDSLQFAYADKFLSNTTLPFLVKDKLPGFDFALNESFAGMLPISRNSNETRDLFFWFFRTDNPAASDEITIWLTGGPGCSSLLGLIGENGPFVWYPGTGAPVRNPWAITRLTNVLYVDQPIGSGYSVGTPNITDERGLAREFVGFYDNFMELFDVGKYKIYLAGESYAGYFVSYIANAFISATPDYGEVEMFNLAGISLSSPLIGDRYVQQHAHIVPFALKWKDIMLFNDTTVAQLEGLHKTCGFSDYVSEWFTFPAQQQPMPLLTDVSSRDECDVLSIASNAAFDANPCFDEYHVPLFCPLVSQVIPTSASSDAIVLGDTNYFNRTDVKKALHVPTATSFFGCVYADPFDDGVDLTSSNPPVADGTLGRIIDRVGNVMIGNGLFDMSLNYNDTLLSIQNITWGGKRGFDKYPDNTFFVPRVAGLENTAAQAQAGQVGSWISRHGLTYFWVKGAGHEIWTDSPGAAFAAMEVLLGRRADLSSTASFSVAI